MNLKEKQLDTLINDETFVDIYMDYYDESYFGYIINYNVEFLVLEKINDDSLSDGICVLFRDNITRIRWSGNEITSTEKLIDPTLRIYKDSKINITNIKSIINDLQREFGYVTISIQDIDTGVCFIGEIIEMDDDTLVMHEFGTKISLDRKFIMLDVKNITLIESGGQYEENIKRLIIEK